MHYQITFCMHCRGFLLFAPTLLSPCCLNSFFLYAVTWSFCSCFYKEDNGVENSVLLVPAVTPRWSVRSRWSRQRRHRRRRPRSRTACSHQSDRSFNSSGKKITNYCHKKGTSSVGYPAWYEICEFAKIKYQMQRNVFSFKAIFHDYKN